MTRTVTALAPWFGSNRTNAAEVGRLLKGCSWVGIPFAGGMPELQHIKASTILVNDLHGHVMNLAMTIADPDLCVRMCERLDALPFHPNVLKAAQDRCSNWEFAPWDGQTPVLCWAIDYFIAVWMARSAKAGTDDEFEGKLPIRWSATGGDSNTRYRSAIVAARDVFHDVMRRCNFSVLDAFEFLDNVKDLDGHGLYVDAPWPDDGDKYRHKFTEKHHEQLAEKLVSFKHVRVVIRFGIHPLIERLYPREAWGWRTITGRTQANDDKSEVLILNGPSCTAERRSK